jgi:hypothetical protein
VESSTPSTYAATTCPIVTSNRNEHLAQLHCYDQELDEATLKAATAGTESYKVSGTIQSGFPNGASASVSYQGGSSETYPSNIYSYDRTWNLVEMTERVHAWWDYLIKFSAFLVNLRQIVGHSSKFSYPSHDPPNTHKESSSPSFAISHVENNEPIRLASS